MYLHVFLFKWNSDVTHAEIDRATAEILALQSQITGLLETHVGPNESPMARGHAFGGVMRFVDRAAFAAYVPHPAHQRLVTWLMPLIEPTELDLQT